MIRVFLFICLHKEKKNETMKKAKERLDMSLERQTGIPTEYLHQDARITIDMDSTAESYLRRGISKQDFLKFVYQITELMEMSIKCGLQMDFDLKNIDVKDEQIFVKTCIGDDGLDIREIREYLKAIAYKTVFVGEDFLQNVYEYLSFIDSDRANSIENISNQVQSWMNGGNSPVAQVEKKQPVPQKPQPQQSYAGLNQIPPAQMAGNVQPNTQFNQPFQQTFQPQQQPKPQSQMQPRQPVQQVHNNADETGVLDPAFWNQMMNYGQANDDPNRVHRQNSRTAFLYNPMTNERIDIIKSPFLLGKSKEADYTIAEGSVSRIHAEITSVSGKFFITDPASTNGTKINEKMIPKNTPIEIVQNDTIKISNIELKFQIA